MSSTRMYLYDATVTVRLRVEAESRDEADRILEPMVAKGAAVAFADDADGMDDEDTCDGDVTELADLTFVRTE